MKKNYIVILLSFFVLVVTCFNSFAENKNSSPIDANTSYKLGAGDRLKVNVFGEESLSGEFEIDGQGIISFPLLGNLEAGGKDVRELEKIIVAKLKDGYLVNPRVSLEVMNFRPFFILGEVKKPGSYPYVNGLKVLNAVALSGGYTYRARMDRVLIRRGNDSKEKEFEATEDDYVMPGDMIRVTERFF